MYRKIKAVLAVGAAVAALGWASSASAGLVYAQVSKGLDYVQNGASAPTLNQVTFSALDFYSGLGDFDGGSLTWPGPDSPKSLFNIPPAKLMVFTGPGKIYVDEAQFDADFPGGVYTFTATNSATSATQSAHVDLDSSFVPAAVPTIDATAYAVLTKANPHAATHITINPFTPDPSADDALMHVTLYDSSPFPGSTIYAAWLPVSTDVVLPKGSLTAGHIQGIQIDFVEERIGDDNGVEVVDDGRTTTALFNLDVAAVPEPATWAMLALGVGALGAAGRRRRVSVSLR
jgi:hypothetical protein